MLINFNFLASDKLTIQEEYSFSKDWLIVKRSFFFFLSSSHCFVFYSYVVCNMNNYTHFSWDNPPSIAPGASRKGCTYPSFLNPWFSFFLTIKENFSLKWLSFQIKKMNIHYTFLKLSYKFNHFVLLLWNKFFFCLNLNPRR